MRAHLTTSARVLSPWEEAEMLVGLARKRIDEGQMRAAFSRASKQARTIAAPKLREYGYSSALQPVEVPHAG